MHQASLSTPHNGTTLNIWYCIVSPPDHFSQRRSVNQYMATQTQTTKSMDWEAKALTTTPPINAFVSIVILLT